MPACLSSALPRLALSTLLSAIALASHAQGHRHDHDHGHADAGHAQHAHVHGVVNVDIALDGSDLVVQLTAPQADVTGFEHAPRSDAERKAVADAIATLRGPGLFVPNPAAGCQPTDVDVHGLADEDDDADGHDHKKDHGHQHGHQDKHDHDDEHEGHSDVQVSYQFHCETPAALESVDVRLEQAFPSIHTINAQLALPQGQFSRTLKSGQTALTWK